MEESFNNNEVYELKKANSDSSPQNTGRKKAMLWVLVVIHSLLLVAGILMYTLPACADILHKIGICEEQASLAYAKMLGIMWIAFAPMVGLYIAFVSPYRMATWVRVLIGTLTAAVVIGLTFVFFYVTGNVEVNGIVISEYYEGNDSWFVPVSMIFGIAGLLICYIIMPFHFKADNIREGAESETLGGTIKNVFVKIGKGILTLKEKAMELYILLCTLLLTWLVFFTAFLVAILLFIMLCDTIWLFCIGLIDGAASNNDEQVYEFTNDFGSKTYLTESAADSPGAWSGITAYKDNLGNVYYSEDNGKTVYKKEY